MQRNAPQKTGGGGGGKLDELMFLMVVYSVIDNGAICTPLTTGGGGGGKLDELMFLMVVYSVIDNAAICTPLTLPSRFPPRILAACQQNQAASQSSQASIVVWQILCPMYKNL